MTDASITAIVASLIVSTITSAISFVIHGVIAGRDRASNHGERIAVLESQMRAIGACVGRVEKKVDALLGRPPQNDSKET